MPFPPSASTITLTGTFPVPVAGGARTGRVVLTPSARLVDSTQKAIYSGGGSAVLDENGHFSTLLLCTDDTDVKPEGWRWRVDEQTSGGPRATYWIDLPSTLGPEVDLAEIAEVSAPDGSGSQTAHPTGPAGGALTGTYPNPALSPETISSFDPAGAASTVQSAAAADATAKVSAHTGATDPHGDRAYADGKLAKTANLSDLDNVNTAHANLGLGGAAVLNVGTTAGTVAGGDDSRFTGARTPTAHAASHGEAGSDPVTLTQTQITGLAAALAALLPLAGGTLTGDVTVHGGDLTIQRADGGGAYRFRVTGEGLDLEIGGLDAFLSVWQNADFTGAQSSVIRLEPTGPHLIGRVQYGTQPFDTVHDIDSGTGVASLGAKNGLTNVRLCGQLGMAGAPILGAWMTGDAILDSAGAWWLCTAGGTPGTWAGRPTASGTVTAETAFGQASAAGSAGTYARGDHTHGTPALATSAPATTEGIGTAAALGTATIPAKADHVHPMAAAGAPAASAVTSTQTTGAATTFAASDHVHAREGFGAPTAQTTFGQSSSTGTATTIPHSDHAHGTPTLPTATISAAGIVQLDGAAADIQALGTQAAGGTGKAADAGHTHPATGVMLLTGDQVISGTKTFNDAIPVLPAFDPAFANQAVRKGYADAAYAPIGRVPSAAVVQAAAPTGVAATDQAAINAAIAALPTSGGVVQLQAGTYVVPAPASASSGCVSMSVNSSALRGMGMGVTTIQLAPGSTGVTGIVRTPSGVANSKITFADFTIDGNAAGQTGSPTVIGFFCGVTPNSTLTDTDITLVRVEATGCTGYGFDPHERTTRLTMIGCVAHDNGTDLAHDGFTLDGCYDSTLLGCTSYNNGRHGFNLVTASTRVQLIGCEAYSNGGNGFTAQNGAKYAQLSDCMAYSNTGAGFVLNGVAQTGQQDNTPGGMHSLSGCTAWSNGTHSYQLVGASYNRLTGCHSQDASQVSNGISDHYRIDESGTAYSTTNTLSACTWAQTSGVTNAAKYGIQEKTASDGPTYVLGCSGTGTTTGSLNLLNATSALLAAHNGTSGAHPAAFAYAYDLPSRHGYIEWNYPPDLMGASGGTAMTAGTIYGMRIDAQAGQPINNIIINIGTAGTTMTAAQCVASIIDGTTGTELAHTGDIATLLQGSGPATLPLTAAFTPTPGQKLGVHLLGNSTGAMPLLVRSSSTSTNGPNAGLTSASPRRYYTAGTSQTSMPSSFTMTSTTATGAITYWVALS